ncbi:GAF and ANTAR domain-containing protein [uncultured Jatrophihabitans sp.]|uniref:GAF and ANTAR domain-containing protein n=1 Tax=uncultured Jatrophihabitans sp. TaxID=1610747 RepID=UPI0035CA1BE4
MTTEPAELAADDEAMVSDLLDADLESWTLLDRISREMRSPDGDVQSTLVAILRSACEVVDGADEAGLNLLRKGRFEPQAVVGEAPPALDLLQQSLGIGPCVDASREQTTVTVVDMASETRWAAFQAKAVELGICSMLCIPLWVDDTRLGSLSLYSRTPDAFSERDRTVANVFATHAALALAEAQRMTNLRQALVNRDVIGQAKGVLMVSRKITADQAFELLSQASQRTNQKLVRIAELVTLTGELG